MASLEVSNSLDMQGHICAEWFGTPKGMDSLDFKICYFQMTLEVADRCLFDICFAPSGRTKHDSVQMWTVALQLGLARARTTLSHYQLVWYFLGRKKPRNLACMPGMCIQRGTLRLSGSLLEGWMQCCGPRVVWYFSVIYKRRFKWSLRYDMRQRKIHGAQSFLAAVGSHAVKPVRRWVLT